MAETNRDKLHIKLHVYDEEIDAVIDRADEQFYREAAKLITARYNAYAAAYKGRKSEHTISLMTLIDIALLYQKERENKDAEPFRNILDKLTAEVEQALADNR